MHLEIDDKSLHDLLYGKKDYIGHSWIAGLLNIIGGLSFGVTIYSAHIAEILVQLLFYCSAGAIFFVGAVQVYKSIVSRNYDFERLYSDIKRLSISESRYSLIAILDTYQGDSSNKVLLNFKKDWNTYMFLSFRTAQENDEENVLSRVAASLKIPRDQLQVVFLTEVPNQQKYSPEYKAERIYDNRYYKVLVKSFPHTLMHSSFSIDHVNYKWMTLDEMQEDEQIKKNNSDVLSVFERYIFNNNPEDIIGIKNICVRLNRKCNLSCAFCLANCESDGLSTGSLLNAISTLKSNGMTKARLGGGEPTLRPDFVDILKYCTAIGLDIIVYSNLIDIASVYDD